ncbi:hypothetical protein [Mesorhizobium ventifaucium]|nr:hypothetical protein [Mesorhizobium ventifaucium]
MLKQEVTIDTALVSRLVATQLIDDVLADHLRADRRGRHPHSA